LILVIGKGRTHRDLYPVYARFKQEVVLNVIISDVKRRYRGDQSGYSYRICLHKFVVDFLIRCFLLEIIALVLCLRMKNYKLRKYFTVFLIDT